jgi:hypothetical protein
MGKLFIVSLYGKWGQLPQTKKKIINKKLLNVIGQGALEE